MKTLGLRRGGPERLMVEKQRARYVLLPLPCSMPGKDFAKQSYKLGASPNSLHPDDFLLINRADRASVLIQVWERGGGSSPAADIASSFA